MHSSAFKMCIKVYNNYNNEAGQLPAAPGPAGAGPPAAVKRSFMVEAAARACRNGRPLNSSINSNLKAAAAAAAAATQAQARGG